MTDLGQVFILLHEKRMHFFNMCSLLALFFFFINLLAQKTERAYISSICSLWIADLTIYNLVHDKERIVSNLADSIFNENFQCYA